MEQKSWAISIAEKIKKKYPEVVKRNRGKIPYTAVDGIFDDAGAESIGWWTNGFYGGILWQLYYLTGEKTYREAAEEIEKQLDAVLMDYNGMDHDSGFRFLLTAVADLRLTGKPESKNRGLLAAANMAGRFNPQGNFIRAWNDEGDGSKKGWAIIDCMMNLPLLYWASEVTKDERFYHIAVRHADTVMKYFIREDGSARHIVEFDAGNGGFLQDFGGQGYEKGSSWTRGQAWALYGFALSYLHTGEKRYLDTAKRSADYFISHIPDNGFIPVDFCQPADVAWEDSSAGAIAASGLILLSQILSGKRNAVCAYTQEKTVHIEADCKEAKRMEDAAFRLLKTLDENRCCWSCEKDELLEKCTAAFHDKQHEFPIIYGDYYFIEAVLRLTEQEIFLW